MSTIGIRSLNRATLERQFLLRRTAKSAEEVIEHLLGLQSQQPLPPYYGLWSRVEGFKPGDLERLIEDRRVVRATLMRCTIHAVTAGDCLTLRPLMAPVIDKQLTGNPARAAELKKIDDLAALAEAATELLAEARDGKELGTLLAKRWPDCSPTQLSRIAQFVVPVLQVPPRGLWGRTDGPMWQTIESWLGRPLDPSPSIDRVVLRYLAAFGPATAADVQRWSGLSSLVGVLKRLKLATFKDPAGRQLFDLPDAPRPDPDTEAPVRLLAEYDNVLLSYADRTRIMDDAYRPLVIEKNGIVHGTVLVDGFVAGIWDFDSSGVVITPFRALTGPEKEDVEREAGSLLAFAGAAKGGDVRILQPVKP
ncbi:winged helix DNA-binding domain-containing protein [Thermoactinospora rubra]|uniref:winged helix DNA-binding domain-containing protein n=1 Tax=Thermoactinospora rubra TaxID=1088767 RepID=UPI000A10A383|nr:winged helix DNA-binding domain-containing protein [Thermoactinospora rubra]